MSSPAAASASPQPQWRRVLFKISGEALMGDQPYGMCQETIARICAELVKAQRSGLEIAVVVGGGNIFRGLSAAAKGMERASADYMGMLATVMNALAMQNAFERLDAQTRVLSAIPMDAVCEPYIRRRAIRHIQKGRIVIFAAGSGAPFFTTDTAAALRAAEMGCDALLKATQVDGIYDSDPRRNPNAVRYDRISYLDVLAKSLNVMDAAAIAIARENALPVVVFSLNHEGGFAPVLAGKGKFTIVEEA